MKKNLVFKIKKIIEAFFVDFFKTFLVEKYNRSKQYKKSIYKRFVLFFKSVRFFKKWTFSGSHFFYKAKILKNKKSFILKNLMTFCFFGIF